MIETATTTALQDIAQASGSEPVPPRVPLKDVERLPGGLALRLENYGDAVVIDGKIILAYMIRSLKSTPELDHILVYKKRKDYVVFDGNQIYDPPKDPFGEEYAPFFATLKQDRTTFYITERYEVTIQDQFSEYGVNKVELLLASTDLIKPPKPIPGDIDFGEYLRNGRMEPHKHRE